MVVVCFLLKSFDICKLIFLPMVEANTEFALHWIFIAFPCWIGFSLQILHQAAFIQDSTYFLIKVQKRASNRRMNRCE